MNSWNYNERDAANTYKKLSLTLFALGLLALALPAGNLARRCRN